MADKHKQWSLATFSQGGQAVAALEVDGIAYRLAPSLARVGFDGQDTVAGLFHDWSRALSALNAAATQVQASDALPHAPRLAPLLYPGKILCAGANYFDHLAEMGMPGAKKEDQRLFFFMKPPRNAVVGEGATVHMPINTQAFDWEVELALVIGAVVAAAVGLIVGLPALRMRGLYLALLTLMVAAAFQVVVNVIGFPDGGPGWTGKVVDGQRALIERPWMAVTDSSYFRYAIAWLAAGMMERSSKRSLA